MAKKKRNIEAKKKNEKNPQIQPNSVWRACVKRLRTEYRLKIYGSRAKNHTLETCDWFFGTSKKMDGKEKKIKTNREKKLRSRKKQQEINWKEALFCCDEPPTRERESRRRREEERKNSMNCVWEEWLNAADDG